MKKTKIEDTVLIKSPAEHGEYSIEPDVVDLELGVQKDVFIVYFRLSDKDGTIEEHDFEPWKTFDSYKEAEDAVKKEIKKAMKSGKNTKKRMTENQKIAKLKKVIRESLKQNFPKWVKLDNVYSLEDGFYLRIPISKRMDDTDEYIKLERSLNKWAKKLGFELYGSGTGGEDYDLHFGPMAKIFDDLHKRLKNEIKKALDETDEASTTYLKTILNLLYQWGFTENSPDKFELNIPALSF